MHIEPLQVAHLDALATVLRHPAVYRHIGGEVPSLADFHLGLTRAMAGPTASQTGQVWLNFLVREQPEGALLGRLEATVHDGLAEVAFLFGPQYWGHGYATRGLDWLCQSLLERPDCNQLWATTLPENTRCQALLSRCGFEDGYARRPPVLFTYDEGDRVYCR